MVDTSISGAAGHITTGWNAVRKSPGPPRDANHAERPFRRGYTAPPTERRAIAAAHTTKLWLSTTLALIDQAVIIAIATACACPALWRGWAILPGLAAAGLGALVIGRQFRALECLTHEASHHNWCRRQRHLNDLLAAALAGAPTGVRLDVYRASHRRHHGRFGTRDDPDLANYRRLGLEDLDRSGALAFAADAFRRMMRYRRRWKETSRGTGWPQFVPVMWAVMLIALPSGLIWGVPCALIGSGIWGAGFYLMLPVVRFLGECNEHIYAGQDTVFDATVSNIGLVQRFLIHPHGDGYHTVHHMWPGVPHHQIRKLHRRLVAGDPDGYAVRLRYRTRILETPARGLPASRRHPLSREPGTRSPLS